MSPAKLVARRTFLGTAGAALALAGCGPTESADREIVFSILSTENSQNQEVLWQPFLEDMRKQTGLKTGDVLQLYKPGKQVKNKATGAMVELPGKVVGKIKVASLFGNDILTEGAVCSLVQSTEAVTTDLEVRMEQTP